MEATRREFLLRTLGVALASKLQAPESGTAARNEGRPFAARPYGSSNFGTWIEDEFGLPAFQYTCNQTTDRPMP